MDSKSIRDIFKNVGIEGYTSKAAQFSHSRNKGLNILVGDRASYIIDELEHYSESDNSVYYINKLIGLKTPMSITNINSFISDELSKSKSDINTFILPEIVTGSQAVLAVTLSMMGYRVWTAIKANSLFGVFNRLSVLLSYHDEFNLGYEGNLSLLTSDSLITSAYYLKAVDKLCNECKVRFTDTSEGEIESGIYTRLDPQVSDLNTVYVKGVGCSECGRGHHDKVILSEAFVSDPQMLSVISKNGISAGHYYWLSNQEGRTLIKDGISYIEKGVISPYDFERHVSTLSLDMILNDGEIRKEELFMG
jgi:hypothetical protein